MAILATLVMPKGTEELLKRITDIFDFLDVTKLIRNLICNTIFLLVSRFLDWSSNMGSYTTDSISITPSRSLLKSQFARFNYFI